VELRACDEFLEPSNNNEDNDGNTVHFGISPPENDMDILLQYNRYKNEKRDLVSTPMPAYKTSVDLLHLLKIGNAPLNLYDKIMDWAKNARYNHLFDFNPTQIPARGTFINALKNQFDLKALEPLTLELELPGSTTNIKLIIHDFKHCFYSLLNDAQLMKENNLLLDLDNVFAEPLSKREQKVISDVNTGDVWRSAHKSYVTSKNSELLCPIIFFIDKTHTDSNGRLCLEQIRFTLGIFKRQIRNQSRAWRTLGYLSDQNQISTNKSDEKMIDYQTMTSRILKSFIEAQKKPIAWNLNVKGKSIPVFFRTPVLFIIGDTDGHDKIVGKYANRTNVKRLCRYCDCPFEKTDDPFYVFKLNKRKDLIKLINDNNDRELKGMSFHCVQNAWTEVLFCDNKLGIFGATPAEIMHCLQKGLYEYLVTSLFSQKQIKKQNNSKRKEVVYQKNVKRSRTVYSKQKDNVTNDSSSSDDDGDLINENETVGVDQMSKRNAFSASYAKYFDQLTRRYGKYLMHQSDRSLPRTHFYTNYTSTGYKNASELTGMLIVFLMVFSTQEGENKLDANLGAKRSSQYIHLFELMLMLETFCKTEEHDRRSVKLFKDMLPSILECYKKTIDRQEGNQMKIIKFHLPLHFADDMLRFGSMANFDSSIGELHHKDFAKKPAKNTQRRKAIFEIQTAQRQIENLVIDRAYDNLYPGSYDCKEPNEEAENTNKNKMIEFCSHTNNLVYTNKKKRNCPISEWKDSLFYNQLIKECLKAIKNKYLKAPIKFFTQHNRFGNIFRGDPAFHKEKNEPWYDWVMVNWGNENTNYVPAKLLLFIEIHDSEFLQAFKFGESYIEGPGAYAIAYSFETNVKEPAHLDSRLVTYGKILQDDNGPILYVFDVNCIADTCIAVPYQPSDDIITATEWLLLQSKERWYKTFITFMEETLCDE
jgi:hypothetical protein